MILNINIGCDPARVQQNKDSFFVNFVDNGKNEYEFFCTRAGAESFKKALKICAEKQKSVICRRVGTKIQCLDQNGIVATFLYDLETGEQLSLSYASFYSLLTHIKEEFPYYSTYPRKLQAYI